MYAIRSYYDKRRKAAPKSPNRLHRAILAAGLAIVIGPVGAQAADVSIGVVSNGLIVDSVYTAAELAKKQGLDVKVVEFTDWVLPNTAVVNGDIRITSYNVCYTKLLRGIQSAKGEPVA